VEEGLALPPPAHEVSGLAMGLELGDMALHGLPSRDLPVIIGASPSQVIAAVPLEPATRILIVDPALGAPIREGLRGVKEEVIELGPMLLMAEPGIFEPGGRIFPNAVSHVLAAEDAEPEHLVRPEIGAEIIAKSLARLFREEIAIALLHYVMDQDFSRFHVAPLSEMVRDAVPHGKAAPTGLE
jgi:hypothetical protein